MRESKPKRIVADIELYPDWKNGVFISTRTTPTASATPPCRPEDSALTRWEENDLGRASSILGRSKV